MTKLCRNNGQFNRHEDELVCGGYRPMTSRMFLQCYPADRYGLFTVLPTGCLRRARSVSARTDTPVPFVMASGWLEGLLSADALAMRTSRQHSQPGRFDVSNARQLQFQTEQGLAQRRVPWPATTSMSRTGSRSCAGDVTLTGNTALSSSRKNLALRKIKDLGCAKTDVVGQPNGYTQLM